MPAHPHPSAGRRPERNFFHRYWSPQADGLRRPYRYQWFLRPCREFVFPLLARAPTGAVLEVGRGDGSALPGELVPARISLDIVRCGSGGNQTLLLGDAQALPFRDASLSGIWGQTMMMHVSSTLLVSEVHRALRPGGVFAFVEPLNGHPLVRLARRVLPGRAAAPRFLEIDDLMGMADRFSSADMRFFFVLSPPALVAARRMTPAVRWLQSVDEALLRRWPRLRGWAWYVAAAFVK